MACAGVAQLIKIYAKWHDDAELSATLGQFQGQLLANIRKNLEHYDSRVPRLAAPPASMWVLIERPPSTDETETLTGHAIKIFSPAD